MAVFWWAAPIFAGLLSASPLVAHLFGSAVGSVLGIPTAGWFVSRYGSRRASIWSSVGLCLAMILPAFANNAPTVGHHEEPNRSCVIQIVPPTLEAGFAVNRRLRT